MAEKERSLEADLPDFLELLEDVSAWVGALDLSRAGEIPAEALSELRDRLLRALGFLHELFALRGEPPPSPKPGVAFGALGPSLRRTLPQRLAAQLADELNAVPGNLLEDLSEFTALGLFSRISDLLRFVRFVEEQRGAAGRQVSPPPAPAGPGPDLSAYDLRIDEAGERIEAPGVSAWFASAPGPRAAGPGLGASFAVTFPGGIALAVADGAEASLGARLSAVVAVRAFCRAAAVSPSSPEAAVRTAQGHLDLLLSALLAAGDETDAFTRVRGTLPAGNARRILAHTRQPEEALRRVPPALGTGLVGAVATAAEGGLRVSVVRLGPGSAEARISRRVTPLLGGAPAGPTPFLAPGARGAEDVSLVEAAGPVSLAPGDALLLGTPALAKGAAGAWVALSTLWAPFPDGLSSGDTARDLLRRAERWGEAEASDYAGALGLGLLLAR